MRLFTILLCLSSFPVCMPAQAAGLRGASQEPSQVPRLQAPDAVTAERVITIEAVAEVRVVPTRLRVVFAVSASGKTVSEASAASRRLLDATKLRLTSAGVATADFDTDFIAAVPVFSWGVEQQQGSDVVAERRTGFRVHYNLHVAVPDEAAALTAIEAAASGEGIDVLAVDYWCEDLAAKQVEAQKKALAAAQAKADLLLAVFPTRPTAINVHENTRVLFPQHLYQNIARAEDSANVLYSRDNLPRVPASRPLQVYYRGLFGDVDALEAAMPGRREIEVVSTVRLYFAAPERPAERAR